MPYGPSSHLHIVHSTDDDDEIIRVSGPLDPDAARQEFALAYPAEFEDVFLGDRPWEAVEHDADAGLWTSVGWCHGACPQTTSLLHAFTYFPWLADKGGINYPPQPAAHAS